MKNSLLNQSLAVRTNVLPEVRSVLNTIEPDYDSVRSYKTDIVQWLKPIVDLSDFYVYPMNGITQGLDWWYYQEKRSVYMDDGDYQWIREKGNPYEDCIKYQSWPSAIDGNFRKIHQGALALDLAYVGSTEIRKIELHNQVEHVFYSLSKPFGIRNVRTGWLFTRKRDKRLTALTSAAKYYNYYAHDVAEKIINNFDIDYVYNQLRPKQLRVCNQLDLTPSNSVWLATTQDPKYKKFFRGEKARICLAEILKC